MLGISVDAIGSSYFDKMISIPTHKFAKLSQYPESLKKFTSATTFAKLDEICVTTNG